MERCYPAQPGDGGGPRRTGIITSLYTDTGSIEMKLTKTMWYGCSVVSFCAVLPLAVTLWEVWSTSSATAAIALKWWVFFGVGLRLVSAGLSQMIMPSFTTQRLFIGLDAGAEPLVRELGFANLCIGLLGILSLYARGYRNPAAVAGGLYYGLVGLGHLLRRRQTARETLAMVSDLYMAGTLWTLVVL